MKQSSVAQHPNQNQSKADAFAKLFYLRLEVLTLIKQNIQMVKAVQRHRAMSMGILGGNEDFREDLLSLQKQTAARLNLFYSFASRGEQLIEQRDLDNLFSAWRTISQDWEQDRVIDNYELHCHLIEQLLNIMAQLAKHLEQPFAAALANSIEPVVIHSNGALYPNRFKQLEVLHYTTRLMPNVAEQIGRIRALSTYLTALGHCDPDYGSKLVYVIQCTKVNNEKLRHQAKRMESFLDKDSPLLSQLKSYEIKLTFLLDMVEQEVLVESSIQVDSSRLYHVATDIIDMYLSTVDEGIKLLEHWHQNEVEASLV